MQFSLLQVAEWLNHTSLAQVLLLFLCFVAGVERAVIFMLESSYGRQSTGVCPAWEGALGAELLLNGFVTGSSFGHSSK